MNKKTLLFLIILSVFTITGCTKTKKYTQDEVLEFVKSNMPGNWIYSEEKIKINNDNSIELLYYDVTDWAYCGYTTNESIISLTKTKNNILKSIPSITAICKNNDDKIVSKAIYKSLYNITPDNIESKTKYYDENDNIVNEIIETILKNKCNTYKYSDIINNFDNYNRKFIKLNARILEVSEQTILEEDYWLLNVIMKDNVTNTYKDDFLIVTKKSKLDNKPSINDTYTFYGEIMGIETLQDENNNPVQVPTIFLLYADKNN